MDLMASVGQLLKNADDPASVGAAIKTLFERLKYEAVRHSKGICACSAALPVTDAECTGARVLEVLKRLENEKDPFYEGMPMLERLQVTSLAHSAVKMTEV